MIASAGVAAGAAVAYLRGSLPSSVPEAPSTDPSASLRDALDALDAPLPTEAANKGYDIEEVRLMRRARDAVERIVREAHFREKARAPHAAALAPPRAPADRPPTCGSGCLLEEYDVGEALGEGDARPYRALAPNCVENPMNS